jgi:uncharacterized protein (UPF0548 family)
MINRSGLNALRGSVGMGQGNIRNENTRSNDMFNSPYAKGGMQTNGPVKPENPYVRRIVVVVLTRIPAVRSREACKILTDSFSSRIRGRLLIG